MTAPAPELPRLLDLLADRSLVGLDAAGERELARGLEAFPSLDAAVLDRTVAKIELALGPEPEALSGVLREQLAADARARFDPRGGLSIFERRAAAASPPPAPAPERVPAPAPERVPAPPIAREAWLRREAVAWLVAAVATAAAVAGWWPERPALPADAPQVSASPPREAR